MPFQGYTASATFGWHNTCQVERISEFSIHYFDLFIMSSFLENAQKEKFRVSTKLIRDGKGGRTDRRDAGFVQFSSLFLSCSIDAETVRACHSS